MVELFEERDRAVVIVGAPQNVAAHEPGHSHEVEGLRRSATVPEVLKDLERLLVVTESVEGLLDVGVPVGDSIQAVRERPRVVQEPADTERLLIELPGW